MIVGVARVAGRPPRTDLACRERRGLESAQPMQTVDPPPVDPLCDDARRRADEAWQRRDRAAVLRRRRRARLGHGALPAGLPRRRPNDAVRKLPTVGLALSGGGVRSATYGLGLIRGLAQRGLLPRIDYLSTVSGGGYVGAMLGRLVIALGIEATQAMLAARRSPLLDWLRRNGRYLTPTGSHDLGIAAVTYLRAFVAIHAELMVAGLLFGLVIAAPHLWQLSTGTLDPNAWQDWGSLWLPIAAAWSCALLPGLACGYWVAREGPDPTHRDALHAMRNGVVGSACVAGAVVLAWLAHRLRLLQPLDEGFPGLPLVLIGLASVAVGIATTLLVLATTPDSRGLASARLRRRYTETTRSALLVAAGFCGMGLLDLLSWRLLKLALSDTDWLWGGLGIGGFAAVVLRALAQPLQQLLQQTGASLSAWAPRLLNAAGLLGLSVLLCFWLSTVQWLVFTNAPLGWLATVPATWRAGALAAACLLWLVTTAHNEDMANASSLHGFYRARLTRAYLAVGNPNRPVLHPIPGGAAADVTQVVSRDDAGLREYRPERAGGPLHLINTCLNQTVDDASGLYNADRKGTLLTARPDGFEVGARECLPYTADSEVGTLGKWIAISGAAAAPGAGLYTSRGWALLLFLLGVRLGHWVHEPGASTLPRAGWTGRLWAAASKPLMLWSEASATYRGRARPWWYLSDGGHFDNTGVYALLRRETDFIVLVDASCDPKYEFADLENLVRKARIDFGAEIEFYPHDEAVRRLGLTDDAPLTVLSPQDMADSQSSRGVLLARIRYLRPDGCARGTPEHHGTLLVIKPNLHSALDVDVLAYAQRHADFPHESTGDQSFDEAQWESYHRLGEDAGAALQPAWLDRLPGWSQRITLDLEHPARLRRPGRAAPASLAAPEPAWRRATKNTALGTTIGLSASGTLLLSLWQIGDQVRQNEAAQRAEVRTLFTEVSKSLSGNEARCLKVPPHVSQQVLLLRDLVQNPVVRELDRVATGELVSRLEAQCSAIDSGLVPACNDADSFGADSLCVSLSGPRRSDALSYWHPTTAPDSVPLTWATLVAQVHDRWAAGRPSTVATAPPPAPAPVTLPEPAGDAGEEPTEPSDKVRPPPPTGAPGPATGPTVPPPPPRPAPVPATYADCVRPGQRPVLLYTQVYDEASRTSGNALRETLQAEAGSVLRVAPLENVTRTAALRQQRAPVPWAQPTLIVHQPDDLPCARQLAAAIGRLWRGPGGGNPAAVRELPASLRERGTARIVELWLPPAGGAGDRNAAAR